LLLTAFDLTCEGQSVSLPIPAQRLLAFLALQDRAVLRVYAASTLWLNSSDERAFGSLRSALWRVRTPGYELIEATRDRLRLAPGVAVDFHEGVARARRLCDGSAGLEDPNRDRDLLSQDLLLDWYDDWIAIERERFRQLRVHALESLCAKLAAARRFPEAIEAGISAIKAEPLRESAHRALIKVHLTEGNHGEALHQYHLFRELLRAQLGVEPSSQLNALFER
jgi:DNA-binding SARP family transcriptional activator